MQVSKRFLHDRVVLILLTLIAAMLVIGVSLVLLRFDPAKNPTTIAGYRPNLSGSTYVSGSAINIYELPLFMVVAAGIGALLSLRLYHVKRDASIFILGATLILILLATITANSLISLQ